MDMNKKPSAGLLIAIGKEKEKPEVESTELNDTEGLEVVVKAFARAISDKDYSDAAKQFKHMFDVCETMEDECEEEADEEETKEE